MAKHQSFVPDTAEHVQRIRFFNRLPIQFLVLGSLLVLLIGLRVYKAHHAGIIHDEFWTLRDFCASVQAPMTIYTSTNNHILNSLSIVLMRPVFGNYEHYIRIHTVLWGALFCIAAACILHHVIRSALIRICFLLVILLNWYIFDLSYLARGYAMALGMVFTCVAVFVHGLSQNKRHLDAWPITVLLIVTNVIALGAMLSSLAVIVSLNFLYAAILLWPAKGLPPKNAARPLYQIIAIIVCSGLSLYLLYFRILSQVRQLSSDFEVEPFFSHMKQVLFHSFIKMNAMAVDSMIVERYAYVAVLVLAGVCLAAGLVCLLFRARSNTSGVFTLTPSVFVLLLTGCVFIVKVLQLKVAGMSLGMPRNSVFFLVLMLISGGIVIDYAVTFLSRAKFIRFPLQAVCAVILGLFIYLNLPSLRAVDVRGYDWGKQSAVGPLVRRLSQIDPQWMWRLNIDGYADCLSGAITYYQRFGYKVQRAPAGDADVFIVPEHPAVAHRMYLDYRYFLDFHCAVMVSPASFSAKQVFYQAYQAPGQ